MFTGYELYFVSYTIHAKVYPLLKEEKRGYITLGMKFRPIETKKPQGKDLIINYQDFPMTKTGIILFLILWQMGSYHYLALRELKS